MWNKRTYFEPLQILLNGNAIQTIQERLASQILWIYGLSAYLSGVASNGAQLLVPGDDLNVYVNFRDGSNNFIELIRVSDLVFSSDVRVKHYPVFIPGNLDKDSKLDLDKSQIFNPTGITRTLLLGVWYIPKGVGYEEQMSEQEKMQFS